MRVFHLAILFLFSLFISPVYSQGYLEFSGTVLGYHYDPDVKLLQRKKAIEIEGSLKDVQINVVVNGEIQNTTFTNAGGQFKLNLNKQEKSYIKFFKEGYGSSSILIDLNTISDENANNVLFLSNIELLLNGVKNTRPIDNGKPFGRIYFDPNVNVFKFQSYDIREKNGVLQRKDNDNSPYDLIISSIRKNETNNLPHSGNDADSIRTYNRKYYSSMKSSESGIPDTTGDYREASDDYMISDFSPLYGSKLNSKNLKSWRNKIDQAWEDLKKRKAEAKTREDSVLISMQQTLIENAEAQLKSHEEKIQLQQDKIAAQNKINTYLLFLLIAGLIIGALILFGWWKNKKLNEQLSAKNKKISESISYAEHIQSSILWPLDKVKKAAENSFILWQPLERVGGDFYWFSEKDDTLFFSAVDCTGHGVPGGFMSMISNTLLNEIVNEKGLENTDEILNELNLKIRQALQQESEGSLSQEGMDLAFCKWDKKKNSLQFSGAMNPLYLVRNGVLTEYKGDLKGIGGVSRRRKERPFKKQDILLEKGDCLYVFSDGYMDQFGGTKGEKFNSKKFQDLLCKIQHETMDDQHRILKKELLSWMGNTHEQIDDVLVLGIKV